MKGMAEMDPYSIEEIDPYYIDLAYYN